MGRGRRTRAELNHERIVGVCGSCQGDVVFDAAVKEAKCACGATCIPRGFMVTAVRMKR